jgi:hypothetical protein
MFLSLFIAERSNSTSQYGGDVTIALQLSMGEMLSHKVTLKNTKESMGVMLSGTFH